MYKLHAGHAAVAVLCAAQTAKGLSTAVRINMTICYAAELCRF